METCCICGRELKDPVSRHHFYPRKIGKRKEEKLHTEFPIVKIHDICHKQIHAIFSESELAKKFNTVESLTSNLEMARFIEFIKTKPLEFTCTIRRSKNFGRNPLK